MKVSSVLIILLALSAMSCQQEKDDVTKTDGGVCILSISGGSDELCIDFPQSISANAASDLCDKEHADRGYNGISYTSGHANKCSNTASLTVVGTCTLANGIVYRLGSTGWNAATGEVECTTNIQGTWAAP